MILKAPTNGSVSGTGTLTCESRLFGGALITSDGTNAAVVTVQNDDANGTEIFDVSSKIPFFANGPISCSNQIYY